MSYIRLGQAAPTATPNILTNLLATGQNKLIIRSQITPDITIDLSKLLTSDPNVSPQEAVQGEGNLALNIIKPEIEAQVLGVQKIVAPYGRPTQDFTLVAGAIAAGLLLVGGVIAFSICRKI